MMEATEKIKEILHNEENFQIRQHAFFERGKKSYTIMIVNYPDCPCPKKIMLFRGEVPMESKRIMPHFGLPDSPVARFEPTDEGWQMACKLADVLLGEQK